MNTLDLRPVLAQLDSLDKQLKQLRASILDLGAVSVCVKLNGEVELAKRAAERACGIAEGMVDVPRRPEHIVWPRQLAMWAVKRSTGASDQQIAVAFGKKDHGTVWCACKSVENRVNEEGRRGDRARQQRDAVVKEMEKHA